MDGNGNRSLREAGRDSVRDRLRGRAPLRVYLLGEGGSMTISWGGNRLRRLQDNARAGTMTFSKITLMNSCSKSVP